MINSLGTHKAFSILEMTVVMGITAVIMVMLSNVLTTAISISQQAVARSFTREEVSTIVDAISSDINAANEISNCGGDLATGISCTLTLDQEFTWTTCSGSRQGQVRICKQNSLGENVYVSSDNLNVTVFTIEQGFEEGLSEARRNVLVTIAGDHVLEALEIKNIFRQTAVSTRNYLLSRPVTL